MSDDLTADGLTGQVRALKEQVTSLESTVKSMQAKMHSVARDAAEEAIKSLTIQKGQNCTISGQGRNMTVGFDGGGAAAQITAQAVCNADGTITITWNTVK